jgi:hypothetical protein
MLNNRNHFVEKPTMMMQTDGALEAGTSAPRRFLIPYDILLLVKWEYRYD